MFATLELRVQVLEKELKTVKRKMGEEILALENIFIKYFGKDFRKDTHSVYTRDGSRSRKTCMKNKRKLSPVKDHQQDSSLIKRTCVSGKARSERQSVELESLDHSARIEDNVIVFDYHHGNLGVGSPPNLGTGSGSINNDSRGSQHESQVVGNKSSRKASTSMSFGFNTTSSIENSPKTDAVCPQIGNQNSEEEIQGQNKDSQPSTSSSSTNFECDGDSGQNLGISNESNVNPGISSNDTPPDVIAECLNSSDQNHPLISQGSSNNSRILVRSIHIPFRKRSRSKSPILMSPQERWLLSSKRSGAGKLATRSRGNGKGSISNDLSLIEKSSSELSPRDVENNQNNSICRNSDENPEVSINMDPKSPRDQQHTQSPPGEQLAQPQSHDSVLEVNIISLEGIQQGTISAKQPSSNTKEKDDPLPPSTPAKLSVRQRKKLRKLEKARKTTKQGLKVARAFVENDGHKSYLTRPKVITIDSNSSPEDLPFFAQPKKAVQIKTSTISKAGTEAKAPGSSSPTLPENTPDLSQLLMLL